MLILISGGTKTIDKLRQHPEYNRTAQIHIGGLITPSAQKDINWYLSRGMQWACDNDCFTGLKREKYIEMLKRYQGVPGCLWVVAPDVVADARATLTRFKMWEPVLRYYGYPVAFVGQDGLENMQDEIPWYDFECFFVGGSTEWKLGKAAAQLVLEAKSRGKMIHMGRINTRGRFIYAKSLGVDSLDGRTFSSFGNTDLPWGLAYASRQFLPISFKERAS